jgi:hypothetical protein
MLKLAARVALILFLTNAREKSSSTRYLPLDFNHFIDSRECILRLEHHHNVSHAFRRRENSAIAQQSFLTSQCSRSPFESDHVDEILV